MARAPLLHGRKADELCAQVVVHVVKKYFLWVKYWIKSISISTAFIDTLYKIKILIRLDQPKNK